MLFNPLTLDASMLASTTPATEVTGGSPGASSLVPRADHQHPRLTSVGPYVLDGTGKATVMFTRTFPTAKQPGVVCTLVEAGTSQPVIFVVDHWLDDVGATWTTGKPYGGCVIQGFRMIPVPQNLATLLLSAAQTLVSPSSASGAAFSCVAVASSQP